MENTSQYLGQFDSLSDVAHEFREPIATFEGATILLAYYEYISYSGEAFVLLERDGKLFEVNASHCSCYGLEDCWSEEETSLAALRHRLDHGTLRNADYGTELEEVVKRLEQEPAS